ncbi:hypothetical protein KOW79_021773 [Hemibagrus wyckioides]|uniref:Uncharacterized protein n=1 Tax=Hemibagrus wyckioides TaxID=337641 RepID=A0A9D3N2T8_9TELE|nr:hypothetical protein KOW79_021773 [Hemibagrus wyckioides]
MMVTAGATWSDLSTLMLVTEGTEVLEDLDVPRACTLFTGLMDTLHLSYNKQIFLQLDLEASLKKCS